MISPEKFTELEGKLKYSHTQLMLSMKASFEKDELQSSMQLKLEEAKADAYNSGQITGSNEATRKAQLSQMIQEQIEAENKATIEAEKARHKLALDSQEYKFATQLIELYQLLKE